MARSRALSPEGLREALRAKPPAPVYLVFGEEDLLVDEGVDALVSASVEEGTRDFNLDVLRGSEAEAKQVAALASAFPMMAGRRAVIVRECDRLPEKELLLPYLERPSPSTVLVLAAGKPDFRTSFFKAVEEHAVLVECRQLYDNEVPGWVRRRVESAGRRITPEACELLPAYVGKSLREIQQEIDKLFIFAGGRSDLTAEDVSAVVGLNRQFNIFELQNAIGTRNLGRALTILESMMKAGEQPTGMIVMLTRYFQKLLAIRSHAAGGKRPDEIGPAMRIVQRQSRFFLQEVEAARRFTDVELEAGFQAMAEADEQLKSTSMDQKLVMTLLVYSLARPAGAA